MRIALNVDCSDEDARNVFAAFAAYSTPSVCLRALYEGLQAESERLVRLGLEKDASVYSWRAAELRKLGRVWLNSEETLGLAMPDTERPYNREVPK